MHQTLVLNAGYQPINAVPFSRALKYLFQGKVEVLEEYDQPIHPDWKAPAVVRLLNWFSPRIKRVKFSRQHVLARDRWRCQYCGKRRPTRELTFDHILPRSRGGRTTWENIVAACVCCNTKKANRTPEEVGMRLLKKPVRPNWIPIFSIAVQNVVQVPPEWREYWTTELLP